uniref:Leucine-rich repeat-containing N-terminal plant-type domain-containing protein n=1 Tax=Nelumbo nucifera TaxID=4432 RepID=A0A822Y223_NELNU|nr:TPA_asm: hypothetical protein HUJ06_027770 [Nelumbo nucifera]
MDEKWKFSRFRFRMALLLVMFLLSQNLDVSWSLNAEGLALLKFREGVVDDPYGALSNWNDDDGFNDPCLWFGVECSEGKVVALNLKDLCIGGPLAPEIGNLILIKSIILRNNSFFGIIPEEIGKLKELEELDLGYNNFSGPLPSELGNNLSLAILLLDNNSFLDTISPELRELNFISEHQIDENQLTHASQGISCNRRSIPWNIVEDRDIAHRSLLRHRKIDHSSSPAPASPHSSSPAPAPARSSSPAPAPARSSSPAPAPARSSSPAPAPARSSSPAPAPARSSSPAPPGTPAHSSPSPTSSSPHSSSASLPPNSDRKNRALEKHKFLVLSAIPGASIFFIVSVIAIFYCRSSKVVTVKPWSTGLSGQLQKAFVTGHSSFSV